MDAGDISSGQSQFLMDRAVEQIRAGQEQPGCAECIDCGEPIPADRRRAVPGCCRCLICQEAFEREP